MLRSEMIRFLLKFKAIFKVPSKLCVECKQPISFVPRQQKSERVLADQFIYFCFWLRRNIVVHGHCTLDTLFW